MARQEQVLTVFVASPSDVRDERAKLEEVILELNAAWSRELGVRLDLVRWETHAYPGLASDAQEVINQQVPDDYDLFVGIMWHRYGTPTGRAGSGTVEEFSRAKARYDASPESVRIMMYFKDEPVAPSHLDPVQLGKVNEFRESLGEEGALYWKFTGLDEFEKLVRLHLSRQVQAWKEQVRVRESINQEEPAKLASEKANEETENDLGVLDLIDIFENRFGELQEIAARIGDATEDLGSKVTSHVTELNGLPKDLQGKVDRKEAKRLISRAAADMDHFAARLDAELPLFKDAFNSGMDAMISSVPMMAEFGPTEEMAEQAAGTLTGITTLRETMVGTEASMREFRYSADTLPPMTSGLNRAKRRVVSSLDKLIAEISNGQRLLGEAEAAVRDVLRDKEA